jgi:hypothetical protein
MAQQPVAKIGDITQLNGDGKIVRDQPYDASVNFTIQSNDEAITTNGRMAITFLDDSMVRLTENSQLYIDEYIYDPNPNKSKMAITFGLGTARFISSKLNKIAKNNIQLKTPTANIAIRGTDFTTTVDELGRSLIILLPDEFGVSSGEIEITTAIGSVILNKPFESTSVSVFESAPTKPVILDLTLDAIDNMLIVSPPKEDDILLEEEVSQENSILDFNGLDIDYLADDDLAEDDLEFTELDINYLDVNFLEDLLDVLDALETAQDGDGLAESGVVKIVGTTIGQDKNTQITSIIDGERVSMLRSVSNYAKVDIDKGSGYTVIFTQDGVSNTITLNGGGSNTISIKQGS